MEEKSYKEYLKNITTFVFDIDGVLTDGNVIVTTKGRLLRRMNIKDGYALKTAVDSGFNVCIISGGSNEGVRTRLRGLGVTNIYLGISDKTEQLEEFFDIYDINPENVLYMGDDIPDLYVMQKVGLPCCPQDAAPEIKAISKYVSHRNGGKGAARDVIEQVMKVQGKWVQNSNAKFD
ncbi:MAG: HAD-IIIA family hydrolase [Flavobacteriaceae bacterium]|nr:HAD-IIIA family hydrolase [Flavobacteriaceae bacterium]NNK73923.1 HAD-IIIA family hydrolase [Flavobacteriaceae bacterium]